MSDPGYRKGLHWLAVISAVWGVVLIKWGALVTTENAGMAFPDWPLSNGSINPDGWLRVWPLFLEHSHRILGAGMGILILLFTGAAWAGKTSRLVRGLSIAALMAVIFQGVMGGMRVVRISDGFAIFHGFFAQVFFCLLVLLVIATSRGWEGGRRLFPAAKLTGLRVRALLLLAAVALQLLLGAGTRHLHRFGLVATDYPMMNGQWIPPLEHADVVFHFLHRWWAFGVFAAAVACVEFLRRGERPRTFLRTAVIALGLILMQMVLGIGVVLMASEHAKHPWASNLHVLNGLAVLAAAFVLTVQSVRAVPRGPLIADPAHQGKAWEKAAPKAAA